MKKYFVLCLTVFALCACNHINTLHTTLSEADRLMENHPDRARKLLLGIKEKINKKNLSERMSYGLLMTEADDKCYITHTSDSVMSKVTDYYENHGSPYQKIKAFYFMGRVYSDMQYRGSAIDYFKKAIDLKCDDDSVTYTVRALANNWIGQNYMQQNMYKEAFPYFNESYHYALLAKNKSIIVYFLRDIGRSYIYQKQVKKGIALFERAAYEAKKSKQEYVYKLVLMELAKYFTYDKEYDKAKETLRLSDGFTAVVDLSPYYINYGNLYKATNKLDSAIYYYNKCISINGNINDRREAARSLCAIYFWMGNNSEAKKYALMSWNITNSVEDMAQTTNDDLIYSLNKKIEVERENSELQKEKSFQFILFVLVICFFIITLLSIINYNRNRKVLYKQQEEKLKNMLSILHERSKETINDNSNQIKELTEQLSLSEKQKNKLQNDLLQAEKQVLMKKNEQIEAEQVKQDLLIKQMENSTIYQSFHTFAFNPTAQDFVQLKDEVNKAYERFTYRIKEICPQINTRELQICCMIKIGMRTKEIKNIFNSSSESISMCKIRLYKKIFNENGNTEDFDEFIRGL